jgi:hypothetical protein
MMKMIAQTKEDDTTPQEPGHTAFASLWGKKKEKKERENEFGTTRKSHFLQNLFQQLATVARYHHHHHHHCCCWDLGHV